MRHSRKLSTAAILATLTASPVLAGVDPIPLGTALPYGQGGLIGLVAAAVVAGVFIARRKR